MIGPRSSRTFFEALGRARLQAPTSQEAIGERFLRLLVLGIDHELVGTDTWYERILGDAQADAHKPEGENGPE